MAAEKIKQLLVACTLIGLHAGCGSSNCEQSASNYRPRECAIKVESRYFAGNWLTISGSNAYNSGLRNRYSDLGSWYPLFENHIDIGDTVVKRKNELVFYVHKKDTVLAFPYECNGKVFK